MNEELFQLYLKYLSEGKLNDSGTFLSVQFGEVLRIVKLEPYGLSTKSRDRGTIPEFQAALKVFNSPLIKALA